jgi:glycosyltransferase involved in cell wall biosynthesis
MTNPERPRVFLVAHAVHDRGGMERACAELIRGGQAEFRFTVVSIDLAPDLRGLCEWIRVPAPLRPMPLRFAAFFVLAGVRLLGRKPGLVHTVGAIVPNRVDVAAVHFCHAGYRATGARRSSATAGPLRRASFRVGQWLALMAERYCYRPGRLHAFAAVSEGVGHELLSHYPGIPVHQTPNGVDIERYRPDAAMRRDVRGTEGVNDGLVAIFVGGDWSHKGLSIAIEATGLATKAGVDAQLWILGDGQRAPFQALAERIGIGRRVRFFGSRPDVERFYAGADVFVLPTAYETFSLVAHEAAACALPVVAPAVSGITELVGDDEAGIIVPRSAQGVAEAIIALAFDAEKRERLGGCGRRRATAYTWERAVRAVAEVYRRHPAAME